MSAADGAWTQHALLASRRREFLGTSIHALTMAETLAIIEEAIRLRRPLHHVVVNVATIVSMRQSAELHEDIAAADMVNVDGKGVLWGARLCGVELPERVANYDVMLNLFSLCAERGYKPFLLGAEQHVLDAVATRLAKDYPSLVVAGRRNGYFKPDDEAGAYYGQTREHVFDGQDTAYHGVASGSVQDIPPTPPPHSARRQFSFNRVFRRNTGPTEEERVGLVKEGETETHPSFI